MTNEKLLSIVTPTRGNFSERWFQHLCDVNGNDVEFVLVYPPGVEQKAIADPRFRLITSPLKGEVMQRFVGLLNVSTPYVMALDDDDFVHPDILRPIHQYFQSFPESWFLRLSKRVLNFDQEDEIYSDWQAILNIDQLTPAVTGRSSNRTILQETPIAPLKNKFDVRFLVSPYLGRKGMHGGHVENFNNKVWKTELVQQALADMSGVMSLMNALTWIPKWSLDRLLGLFIQAKFFEEDKIVGHWMPHPEQIRYIQIPQTLKNEFRLMLPSDALLLKRFPQFGYFWNLCFEQFWIAMKKLVRLWMPFRTTS